MILGKLQQAPVRAMSDIFPNLCNALADMKRYSGILRKDFLNFSPEHPKFTFKKVRTLFSFSKYKNLRAVSILNTLLNKSLLHQTINFTTYPFHSSSCSLFSQLAL